MTVLEIVEKFLILRGYSGLYDEYDECGCEISDLAPCSEMKETCEAGYKAECTEECEHEVGRCTWHIQREKPK